MLLAVSPQGINLQTLKLTLPAVALGDIAPHPVFQTIGWRGKFTLNTQNYQCTWAGVCTGKLDAIWHDAGVDILPTHNFGDYNIQINAQAGDIGITLSSAPNSAIAAEGSGRVTPKEGLRFTGTLKGDPDTVGRLPNIMDRNAKQTTTPGVVELHFP